MFTRIQKIIQLLILKKFVLFNTEKLEDHYNIPGIVIRPELRFFEINKEYLMNENLNIPLRIREAFYGIDAQKILGINENKKEKVYKK